MIDGDVVGYSGMAVGGPLDGKYISHVFSVYRVSVPPKINFEEYCDDVSQLPTFTDVEYRYCDGSWRL